MKDYGLIIHPEDFDEILNVMTPEEAGEIFKNLIRAFKGDELKVFEDRYMNLASDKLCGRVIREKELSSQRAIAGAIGGSKSKPKAKSKQIESKDKANGKQKKPPITNNQIPITNNQIKNIYGANQNVLLTDEEFEKLKSKFPDYKTRIDDLSFYLSSKGVKYASHYMTILSWARKEEKGGKVIKTNQFTQISKSDIDFDDLEKKLVKN